MLALAKLVQDEPLIQCNYACEVHGLLFDDAGDVCGVKYCKSSTMLAGTGEQGQQHQDKEEQQQHSSAVVLATCGFGANRRMVMHMFI